MYFAMLPWLVFAVADRSRGVGIREAAFLAAAAASVVLVVQMTRLRLWCLPAVGLGLFVAIAVATGFATLKAGIGGYGRAVAVGLLAIYFGGTIWRVPETLRYCGDEGPASDRRSDSFQRLHRRLTLRWSISCGLISVSLAVGALTGTPLTATVFDWLLPIGFLCVASSSEGEALQDASQEAASMGAVLDGLVSSPVVEVRRDAVRSIAVPVNPFRARSRPSSS